MTPAAPGEGRRRGVGQLGHGGDRLGPGQQPDRTRPVGVPAGDGGGAHRRGAPHGPFGHMALEHLGAPDLILAQPVGQPVDQRRQPLLGHGRAAVVELALGGGDEFHPAGRKGHHLDAKTGIYGLQPGREQPGQGAGVAAERREAHPHGEGLAVEPVEGQLEPPPAPALGGQPLAQPRGDVAGRADQIVQHADRLGEGQPVEPGAGRPAIGQRLLGPAQGLIEPPHHQRPEPPGQLGPGQVQQSRDTGQAQPGQLRRRRRVQPQGCDRQRGENGRLSVRGDHHGRRVTIPRQGPGRAEGVGDRAARRDAVGRQPGQQVFEHRRLAVPQVGDAGDVERQPVGPVGRHGRREAHAPVAQRRQRRRVAFGISVGGDELRNQGRGVRGLLTGVQAQRPGGGVQGMEPAGSALGDQEGEGPSLPLVGRDRRRSRQGGGVSGRALRGPGGGRVPHPPGLRPATLPTRGREGARP